MKPLPERLLSLDAFRGFAIAGMVLVNNPGDWSHLYSQLAHARWHGWTFTDWIFPFFLFAVGLAMSLTLARRSPEGRIALLASQWRRAAAIVAIGVALNAFPSFDWATLRLPGVLQRIGLCVAIAAPLVLWFGVRGIVAAIGALFVAYTVPMLHLPVPGADGVVAAGRLEPGMDFGAWIDRAVFGSHVWRSAKTWDPEGLWSTLPAVATLLLGVLAGHGLRSPRADATERTVWLLLAGLALLWAGAVLDTLSMPINKNLWTPSYTLFTGGWALLVFGTMHWLLDAAPRPGLRVAAARWLQPLAVFGMNALFVFVLSGVVARLLGRVRVPAGAGEVSLREWLFAPIAALPLPPQATSLLWAVGFVAAMYGVARVMWMRRWFVRV